MDEETIQAINKAAEHFCTTLSAVFEPVMELANKASALLAETVNAIFEAIQHTPDAVELRRKAQAAIEKRQKERSKWRRMSLPIIHPLLLDKRSKIHRCRNAI